jgi:hypothetical protein
MLKRFSFSQRITLIKVEKEYNRIFDVAIVEAPAALAKLAYPASIEDKISDKGGIKKYMVEATKEDFQKRIKTLKDKKEQTKA